LTIPIPATAPNGATMTVRVHARDAASNTSDEASLVLTIGDSTPPVLTVLEPADGATVAPGGILTVRAHATDDVGVKRFTVAATGVLTASDTRDISPAITPADATFSINVPTGTPAGTITVAVEAFDGSGASSGRVSRNVTVADVVAPA